MFGFKDKVSKKYVLLLYEAKQILDKKQCSLISIF